MKFVGGAFDYWWLINKMPAEAYEDVISVMRAEGEAEQIRKQRTKAQ